MVYRFLDYKDRTSEHLMCSYDVEDRLHALEYRNSIEAPVKEAMFALEITNPLGLYDCLIPEINAYRPLKLDHMRQENQVINFRAKHELQ